jgi:hypothetical protein
MNSILIVVLAFLILFILQNIINNRMGINDLINVNLDKVITNNFTSVKDKKQGLNNYIKEKSEVKVEYKDPFYKFPDPMLSNISHPLSKGFKPTFQNLNESEPDMSDLNIIRKSNLDYYMQNPKVFNPMAINKDTMNANPGNFTLQGLAKRWDGKEESISMTSDEYLTKYPKYSDSNITNELTNVGYFFDNEENNKYIDLKSKILPDNCSLDGDSLSCEFNNKLQEIPDKLMKNNSQVLNSIGVLVDNEELYKSTNGYEIGQVDGGNYKIWNYADEKGMNGGVEFGSVYGSGPLGTNETYANVTDNLNCSSCAI